MIPCSWKETFGVECPTCGAQRSFFDLLNGDLVASFISFPALLPLLMIAVFLPFHFLFKFKFGARLIVILFTSAVALIVINFILKVVNGSVFH